MRTVIRSLGQFRAVVARMHLMLQPSYTESFNMVTADGIAEGVPSVVSTAIDWVPRDWQVCADNVLGIAKTAKRLLRNPAAGADGYRALRTYVADGMKSWQAYLTPKVSIGVAA